MAKEYVSKNTLTMLVTLIKSALKSKVDTTDERLSDARDPLAHKGTHITGGSDAITPGDIGAVALEDIVDDLNSTETGKPLSAAKGKELAEMIGNAGYGDMFAATYDTDSDGTVDNADHAKSADYADTADSAADAEKLGGQSPDHYARAGEAEQYIAGIRGQSNGLAPLDENGVIDAAYLPSYVDDVVEGYLSGGVFYKDAGHGQPINGETGKIYVDISESGGGSYRWSGSIFVEIASSDMVEISNDEVKSVWTAVFGVA